MEDILRGKSPAVCAQRVVKQYDNVNIYFKRYDTLLPSGHPAIRSLRVKNATPTFQEPSLFSTLLHRTSFIVIT
jgi:hypothetical protein